MIQCRSECCSIFQSFDSQFRAWSFPSSPSSRCLEKVRIHNQNNNKKNSVPFKWESIQWARSHSVLTTPPPPSPFLCGCEFSDFFHERKLFPVVWLHARPPLCSSPRQSRRFTTGMWGKHAEPLAPWWDGGLENNERTAWTAFPHSKSAPKISSAASFPFQESHGERWKIWSVHPYGKNAPMSRVLIKVLRRRGTQIFTQSTSPKGAPRALRGGLAGCWHRSLPTLRDHSFLLVPPTPSPLSLTALLRKRFYELCACLQ